MEKVSLFYAFGIGLLSFLSPCVLPLVPPYLSYISGVSIEALKSDKNREAVRRQVFQNCLYFVAGFSLLFIALGATATFIGSFLKSQSRLLSIIAGLVIIIFGLHLTGIFRISAFYKEKRVQLDTQARGPLGAFLLGLAFAAGWTPCIGPLLSTILLYASTQETVWQGVSLLAVYSLGLAVPFIVISLALGYFFRVFNRIKRYLHAVEVTGGVMLLILGVLILTNNLAIISDKLSFFNRFAK